jgi:hypothetical protein
MKRVERKISIKVISGQYLRREVEGDVKVTVNPQVHVFVKGSYIDEESNAVYMTKVISKNGYNPRFDSHEFKFNICTPDHVHKL